MAHPHWTRLKPHLTFNRPLILAYSGGADSSVLLAALVKAGQGENLLAATYAGPLHHAEELDRARELTAKLGVEHLVLEEEPLADQDFAANPEDRCYICKKRRLKGLLEMSRERGALILDGTNQSDTEVYRPGHKALKEAGVVTPLARAGLTKMEVGELGRWLKLHAWLTPASACLATRVPYDTLLTMELLDSIRRAEETLALILGAELGSFRVRVHGPLARLEVDPGVWSQILEQATLSRILEELRSLGFSHVALDLEGYVSGSMDRDREKE